MKAITNAQIYTMNGKIIKRGAILWHGSKILDIGANISIPETAERYDVQGGTVIPGLINAHTQAGLKESYVGYVAGDDSNEKSMPITPHLDAFTGINPNDEIFYRMSQVGITTVAVAPGNLNLLGGYMAAVKTAGQTVEEMLLRRDVGMKGAMGDSPKSFYSSKSMPPKTRMNIMALLRETFYITNDYIRACQQAPEGMKPPFNLLANSLVPVINGGMPLFIHLNRRDDIFSALRLAKEFNIEVVLVNATESYLIADRLAQANVKCIISPALKPWRKFELKESQWLAPLKLLAAGVPTAVVPDSSYLSGDELITMAIMMRQAGIELQQVLETMTIHPARILGIADRVGSIAVGKDADMIVYNGEPFSINSRMFKVIINGQFV